MATAAELLELLPGGEVGVAALIMLLTTVLLPLAMTLLLWSSLQREARLQGLPAYEKRDYVAYQDLVDPEIRRDHLAFNTHLHKRFGGEKFLPVKNEPGCYIAFGHSTCRDVMNDSASFTSNPFPDGRLVALNTMDKADHGRVLQLVHSYYTQSSVATLEDRIKAVIQRCTDELWDPRLGEAEVVTWAKRIHMVGTLERLGIPLGKDETWDRVDEVVMLNDAMVALVAPLGGIGPKYESLPRGQWILVGWGLLCAVIPMLVMTYRLGIRCTWQIVRPDSSILFPPSRPRLGLWWHPELIALVPRYFLALHRLLHAPPSAGAEGGEGALEGLRSGLACGKLQMAEALTLLVQLMVNMTSANALCNLVFRLGTESQAVEELRAAPDSKSNAFVQEVLRLDAPLQRNPRRVLESLGSKWSSSPLSPGDQVLLFLGAANMDPAVYDDPQEFRLDREDGVRPLSFGSGMHYCLGSYLVQLEMRSALMCLLNRFDSIKVQGYQRLVDVDVGNWGFRQLRVTVTNKGSPPAD